MSPKEKIATPSSEVNAREARWGLRNGVDYGLRALLT
jgi:hypothetical protein